MRIRERFLVFGFLFACLPLTVIFGFSYFAAQRLTEEQLPTHLDLLANNLEAQVQFEVQAVRDAASLVSASPALRLALQDYLEGRDPRSLELIKSDIAQAARSIDSFHRISLVDLQGDLIATSRKFDDSESALPALFVKSPSDITISLVPGESPVVWFSSDISMDSRRLARIIVELEPEVFSSVFRTPVGIKDSGEVFFAIPAAEAGKVSLLEISKGSDKPGLIVRKRDIPGERFFGLTLHDDHSTLSAFRRIDGTNWTLIVKWPINSSMSFLGELRHFGLLAGALLASLILAGSFLFSKTVTGPVSKLTETVQSMHNQSGDTYSGEPGELTTLTGEVENLKRNLSESKALVESRISELLKSNEYTRAIIRAALDAIVIIDSEGKVIEWNPAAEKVFGYKSAAVVGKSLHDLIIPVRYRDQHLTSLRQYLATGETHMVGNRTELSALRADGSEFPVDISVVAIHEGTSEVYFTAFIRDLSLQRDDEQRLRYLTNIIESAGEAVIGKKLDGTVISWNGAAERIYGYKAEEMIGTSINRVIPPENLKEYGEIKKRVCDGQSVVGFETRRIRKDGSVFPVSLTFSAVRNWDGKVIGISAIGRDTSDAKRSESYLRKSLKEKELLLKEVHHRVKNNMQVISSLLRLQSGHTDTDEARELLLESESRVRSMALIHERLYKSEVFSEVDLKGYIEQLSSELAQSMDISAHGISYALDCNPSEVSIDKAIPCGLLLNELIKVIFNSERFEGRPGLITIGLKSDLNRIAITFSDKGRPAPGLLKKTPDADLVTELIYTLAEQLRAEITVSGDNGFKVQIEFEKMGRSSKMEMHQSETNDLTT